MQLISMQLNSKNSVTLNDTSATIANMHGAYTADLNLDSLISYMV